MTPPRNEFDRADELYRLAADVRQLRESLNLLMVETGKLTQLVVNNNQIHSEAHRRHTGDIEAIRRMLATHDEQDQVVENRVLKIEIERSNEKEAMDRARMADRRISAVISTSVSIIASIAKEAWTFYHPPVG